MRKLKTLFSLGGVLTILFLSGCTIENESQAQKQTIQIGNQVWTTTNLNVDKFRNGDPIPEAQTQEEWEKAGDNKQPAWCYYEQDPANGTKFGKLYNWYAVNDERGLAPEGFHIPSSEEWTELATHLGETAGDKMKSDDAGYWDGNGTNESGFAGLPGGFRGFYPTTFSNISIVGSWWSATKEDYGVWSSFIKDKETIMFDSYEAEGAGLSVRCIKNK